MPRIIKVDKFWYAQLLAYLHPVERISRGAGLLLLTPECNQLVFVPEINMNKDKDPEKPKDLKGLLESYKKAVVGAATVTAEECSCADIRYERECEIHAAIRIEELATKRLVEFIIERNDASYLAGVEAGKRSAQESGAKEFDIS